MHKNEILGLIGGGTILIGAVYELLLLFRARRRSKSRWGEFGEGPQLSLFSHIVFTILLLMAAAALIGKGIGVSLTLPIRYFLFGFALLLFGALYDHVVFKWLPAWRKRNSREDKQK